MSVYYVSSGDSDPNSDYFTIHAAMNANQTSSLYLYNVDGTGVIKYETISDYLWKVERKKFFSEQNVSIKASQSSKLGYPEYFSWIPGTNISVLSSNKNVEVNQYPILTDKSDVPQSDVEQSGIIFLTDYYDDTWNPTGAVVIDNVYSNNTSSNDLEGDPPFTDLFTGAGDIQFNYVLNESNGFMLDEGGSKIITEISREYTPTSSGFIEELAPILDLSEQEKFILNERTKRICRADFSSSSLEGCIFSFDIKRNFLNKDYLEPGSLNLPQKFERIKLNQSDSDSTFKEWNSIFGINDGCNAESIFRNGENRDVFFYQQIEEYINDNWLGRLKQHLWGNYIDDQTCELTTRDPDQLKRNILYCYYYFGASDDIYNLGLKSYPDYSTDAADTKIRWHIGLGGKSKYSKNVRFLTEEYLYLPVISEFKTVNKVMGLPPRTLYIFNIANDKNLANLYAKKDTD